VLIRNQGAARSNSHSRCELTVRGSHRQFILFHSGTAGRHTAPGAVFRVANAGLRVRRPTTAGCVANSLRHGFPGDAAAGNVAPPATLVLGSAIYLKKMGFCTLS
jgi:hypothetical protein